jgi:hypothetical protein
VCLGVCVGGCECGQSLRAACVCVCVCVQMAADHPSTEVGVFFCGPKAMSSAIHLSCNKSTSTRRGGTKFFYHKENF